MSIDQEYKNFSKWCRDNPAYDLDPRLHTHSGRINDGGYISHKRTGTAFKAWQASRQEGEPIGFLQSSGVSQLSGGHPAKLYPIGATPSPFESSTIVYTHPARDGQDSVAVVNKASTGEYEPLEHHYAQQAIEEIESLLPEPPKQEKGE